MHTAMSVMQRRLYECFVNIQNKMGSTRREITVMPEKDIVYQSQMIVSNIQMTIVLIIVFALGITLGYLQAEFDPENRSQDIWTRGAIFSFEIIACSSTGSYFGIVTAVLIEILRQHETKHKKEAKEEKTLNFEDEEEERLSLITIPELKNLNHRQLAFQSDSDEDEDLSTFVNLRM